MIFKDYQQKPMFIVLPQFDELFPRGSVQRIIDRFVDKLDLSEVEKTYKEGGCPPYHPKVLLKVVLYAYSRNIYGCRPIADLCRLDMICQWFTNFESPSFSTINRFRSEHMGLERTLKVFSELVEILVGDGLISFEQCTYVDGTTVESKASRTKLVWNQTCRRYAESNTQKIEEILKAAEAVQTQDARQQNAAESGQDGDGAGSADGDNSNDGGNGNAGSQQGSDSKDTAGSGGNKDEHGEAQAKADNDAPAPGEKVEKGNKKKKKYDRSVHMTAERVKEIRDLIDSGKVKLPDGKMADLKDRLDRADRYRHEDELCGSRSGTATTDPDSVAMHPKDDVRHTGPCLPMYNLQLMTQSQFILWAGLYGNPSDTSVFPGFLDSIPENFIPDMMACDAGYGTYVNVTLAERKEIKSFFKYNKYDKESAPRFKADPYSVEYMPELEDGSLKCPGGTLKKEYEVEEEQHGITVTTVYYRTDECAKCPLREECHKKDLKDFREAKRKKEWAAKKQEVKERLDSKLGQTLLSNRSRDVEPTFAHTKWAGSYRRCRHFGAKKCNMDLLIRAIAHNLKKYSVYITELIKIAKKRAEKGSGKGCTTVFSVQIRA